MATGITADPLNLGALNPNQLDAVLHDEGPLLVLAGAGSGKTRVIIHRIARLLLDGVPAERILGVTFTNKAAREMRERLRALAGRGAARVRLSTFHALGLALLRQEYKAAGLSQGFCIYDTSDQLSLVRDLMRRVKVADRRLDANKILQVILKTKRDRLEEVALDWGDDYELAALELYPRYVEQMRAYNALDFDDLLLRTQDVLAQPEVRERWSDCWHYILVDEYQDTSPEQLELVQVLAGQRRNVCVVGDDDQSIYSWRGAVADNILAFGQHFKGAVEVVLDQNYRSTENILSVANAVIKNNKKRKEKSLWSASGAGEPVQIVACQDAEDEAVFVCEEIHKLLYADVAPDEIAVLYRANTQSRIFEETLGLERIPFRVVGGQAFFERKEVRDLVAFVAAGFNPQDEIALRRIINVPPRGIGAASVERLVQFGEGTGGGLWGALQQPEQVAGLSPRALTGIKALMGVLQPASEALQNARPGGATSLVQGLIDQLRLREAVLAADDAPTICQRRLGNLDHVLATFERLEGNLPPDRSPVAEFLANSALEPNDKGNEAEEARGKVTLMTLHAAKGLEFENVFFVGCEEGLLPHQKTVDLGGALDEERRLCYVGITRARQRLWLTWARCRSQYGRAQERGLSRFVGEIPATDAMVQREREASDSEQDSEQLAKDFFAKMRARLD